jgi:hypothetical protein
MEELMAKNFADLYASSNASIALEQRWFVKEETTRGELKAPEGTDFLFTLGGGSIEFSQPFESSPHRSGRHHTNIIKKKKETSFSLSTYFNIDTTKVAAGTDEIDPACRVLWKSLLGKEDTSAGLKYLAAIPNLTFSLFENGDKWARQARGCFIQGGNLQMPGDGEATVEWSGAGKDAIYLGIGKSTATNAGGQTVTLAVGDGAKFKKAIGGLVMIVKDDGTTRSTDTPDGSPRKIVSVLGDVITLDGAALTADSDGSLLAPVFLSYYEPETPAGIDDPQTGLVGSMAIAGYSAVCARSIGINITNDHELVNYCYGSDSLSAPFYVPGTRLTAEVTFESNLSDTLLKLFNAVQNFEAQTLQIVLGAATGRRLQIDLPNVKFPVPSYSVPDTGSIPISFVGNAYQSALDAEDEISVHFK